jgi:hypothetical protein
MTRLGCILAGVVALQSAHGGSPPGYEVEGTLEVQNYRQGNLIKHLRYDFAFAVQGPRWYFRIDDYNVKDSRGNPLIHRNESGSEGNEIYMLAVSSSSARAPIVGKLTNIVQGAVSLGQVPLYDGDRRLLWIAFASGGYLAREKKPKWGLPWPLPNNYPDDYFQMDFVRHKTPPGLPDEMTYRSPGYFFGASSAKGVVPKRVDYPAPFNHGFVAAQYRVTGITNIGELELPLGFEMTRFAPRLERTNSQEFIPVQVWVARVSKVEGLRRMGFLPVITQEGEVEVLDYRFRDEALKLRELRYTIEDKKWRSMSDPAIKRMSEAQRNIAISRIEARKKREPQRIVAILGVLLVAGVPLVYLVLYVFRQRIDTKAFNSPEATKTQPIRKP